ncbi:hypothetical protein GS597_11655 [Synechococcales cyanobacterium C]|uniref:Uncharacterized protein n=1 Tax=Petrachloros mirabilis ULC683 TaxID=2781853 RepID=A0A8K2A0J3_9CYAN|nr:hypothetical protein [Petrachloros mirabilis]NCJ07147.1 hypothetical protein [Petrachloros mirabilis ULC683]
MTLSMVTLTNIQVYPRSISNNQVIDQDLAVTNSQGQIEYDQDISNVGIRNVISVQVNSLLSPPDRKYQVIATKLGHQIEYPQAVYFGHKSGNTIELDLLDH